MAGSDTSGMERWIISLLLAALSAVLWFLLLDTRKDVSTLRETVNKIPTLELRLDNIENAQKEIRSDVRQLEIQRK